jgi:hypothetical protein
MGAPKLTPAQRRNSWYLSHLLACMTLVVVVFLFADLAYFSLTERPPEVDLPLAIRVFLAVCAFALFWFWIRMLVAFFRERPARFPVLWGWALTLGSYMGALAYFWIVWRPANRPSDP